MLPSPAAGTIVSNSPIHKREKINVIIVDDHEYVRRALKAAIEHESDMCVVGEAANGLEAIKTILMLMPDVVLMDILMPEMDGLQAARRISLESPSVRVLIVSQCNERCYAESAKAHGAAGFLPKTVCIDELRAAIRVVAGGGNRFE